MNALQKKPVLLATTSLFCIPYKLEIQKSHYNSLRPNPLLVVTSSLFCIPILSLYLNDEATFYKYLDEMILILIISVFSICRWSNPKKAFRILDVKMARIGFIYFHIQLMKMKPKLYVLLSCICGGGLYQLSRISRKKWNFRYWYVFHFLFHIFAIYTMTKIYYKQPFFYDISQKKNISLIQHGSTK